MEDNNDDIVVKEVTDEELLELQKELGEDPELDDVNNNTNRESTNEYWTKTESEIRLDELTNLSDEEEEGNNNNNNNQQKEEKPTHTEKKRAKDKEEGELSDGDNNDVDEDAENSDGDTSRKRRRREKFTSERATETTTTAKPKSSFVNKTTTHRITPAIPPSFRPPIPTRGPVPLHSVHIGPPMIPPHSIRSPLHPQTPPFQRGPLPPAFPIPGRLPPTPFSRMTPILPPNRLVSPPSAMVMMMHHPMFRGGSGPFPPLAPHLPPHLHPPLHHHPAHILPLPARHYEKEFFERHTPSYDGDWQNDLDNYLTERDRIRGDKRRRTPSPPLVSKERSKSNINTPLPQSKTGPPPTTPRGTAPLSQQATPRDSSPKSLPPKSTTLVTTGDKTPKRTIFIENLSSTTTIATIATTFSPLGNIEKMQMTGATSASVTYSKPESAIAAKRRFHRELLDGSRITVQVVQ